MKLYLPWKRNNHFSNLRHAKVRDKICSVEEFKNILLRERTRCDRNGHGFSLVVFEVVENMERGKTTAQLVKALLMRRFRMIDEIGWFRNQHISVLLNNTDREGAWNFVKDIQNMIPSAARYVRCHVYVYPTDWQNIFYGNGNGNSNERHLIDNSTKGDRRTSDKSAFSTRHAESVWVNADSPGSENQSDSYVQPVPELYQIYGSGIPLWKRGMDIIGAALSLAVLSPLLLFVSIMIKFASSGPVFFKQERVGYLGKKFIMWKFRSMKLNCDTLTHQEHFSKLINSTKQIDENEKLPMTKLDDHPHIIPFGKILRKLCIDELPQIINVLCGKMSIVGPRPPIPYEAEEYLHWHNGRFDAVPGITGLWQVSGKNRLTFDQMIRLDIQYSRQLSIWLDIKIILMTPFAIMSQVKDSFKRNIDMKVVGKNA